MKRFARLFGIAAGLLLAGPFTTPLALADDKPAAPRSLEGLESDLSDLESLVDHLEKNSATWDEKQRASAYQRLLALAEKIGIGLSQQRQLLMTAIQNPPANDPNGGLTKTVTADQKARLNRLNQLDARLKSLKARIAALDPGAAKGGGGGGAAGRAPGPKGTTPTVPGGGK